MSQQKPPHPDAARPPSPAGGEGYVRRVGGQSAKNRLISIGARSRRLKASLQGEAADASSAQPSPPAGEGGERRSRSPGEGAFSAERKPKRRAMPRPGAGVKNNARDLRKDMTDAERKLWSILRNRRLASLKFRRQVPIGPYVADFLSFDARLIVEADGGQHAEPTHDEERNAWLTAQGFRILRFWNSDILNNPDGVTARVMESAPDPETGEIQTIPEVAR